MHDNMPTPIARAIAFAGSEAKLGLGIGVSQAAINKAKRRGKVSAEMAIAIHRFTGGAVPASDLRPDLWRRPEDVPTGFADAACINLVATRSQLIHDTCKGVSHGKERKGRAKR